MSKLKYKLLIIAVILTGIAAAAFAQVDEVELSNLPPVVFLNYEGPYLIFNTREEIRQIGVVLGQIIQQNERGIAPALAAMGLEERRAYSYRFSAGGTNLYWVIHSISGPDGSKLDADIFGLGVDVGVDHIRNLRTIIQGYLQAAYNYSASDALLLAEYITVYNAVYRGNWEYFTNRYKTPVIDNLTRDRAGLSIRYDEWPGRTLMLIPLSIGGLSAVDMSVIADARVIEELRKDDDQGIPARQQMVDLIERQAEEAAQQAQEQRQTAAQEVAAVAEERAQVQQERQAVQEAQQQGQITQQQAEQAQQELDRREQELDTREQQAQELAEGAGGYEELAEQRYADAQQMRQDIASDQQASFQQPVQETVVSGISIETTSPAIMGRLVHLNSQSGRQVRQSPLIHVRTITNIGGKVIAVAGEARGNQAVRLVELNPATLEMIRQGNDDIMSGSLIWVNGNDLYAIVAEGSACYLGRFNTNLELQSRSEIRIHPQSGVSIFERGRLLTQREDGSPVALNPLDLSVIQY